MTSNAVLFSPEVEALVLEAASDPRSFLLRQPRQRVGTLFLEDRPSVGTTTSNLTLAERELVRAHREEAASILRRAAWISLQREREALGLRPAHRRLTVDVESEIETEADIAGDARGHILREGMESVDEDSTSAIRVLARLHGPPWPSSDRMLAASHALVPSGASRLLRALSLATRGEHANALALLRSALDGGLSEVDEASAWANLAHVYELSGRPDLALQASIRGCDRSEALIAPVLTRFALAVDGELADEVMLTGEILRDRVGDHVELVGPFARDIERAVAAGRARPIGPSLRRKLDGRLASVGRRVLDAFT